LPITVTSDSAIAPAATIGFSNVMVGVSIADMVRALAVQAAQGAISAGVAKGVAKIGSARGSAGRNH